MDPTARARLHALIERHAISRGEFVLSSGKRSSYYVDLRRISLSPEGAYLAALALLDLVDGVAIDAIGGPVAAAVPLIGAVAAVSYQLGRPLPGFMVRKEAKAHGAGQQIEGPFAPGMRVAVVDDTATTGGSLLWAVEAVERAGGSVELVGALLDRHEGAAELFAGRGYRYRAVFTIREFGLAPS
ncbi:MAG: orotate phosphoribosyltransferase [Chloroflexota bacterium]|nr:orotate phosphoribosyltransferase [Dehalococcoidia bacterium]MDW8253563.1 orotate phosphoribosyltransferase [Chloroflexota bacterium]